MSATYRRYQNGQQIIKANVCLEQQASLTYNVYDKNVPGV